MSSCLENVAGQGCKNIEHIVIDGESNDGTVEIVNLFKKHHPHVRFISGKDNGQSEAMNKGIGIASGEVIGFLNVDDFYEPGTLKRIQKIFRTLPIPSIAVANCNILDGEGNCIGVNRPVHLSFLDLIKGKEYPFNPSSYFYHKYIHELIGDYDAGDHFVMDLDFLLRAVKISNVYYYDETWGNFRWMEGAKTFEDARAGLMEDRSNSLRERYYKELSTISKLSVQSYRGKVRVLNFLKRCLN